MTRSSRLALVLAGALSCLANPGWSQPERAEQQAEAGESAEYWGDAEESQESDTGWTWFGMGYERRMRRMESERADAPPGEQQNGAELGGN